MQALIVQIGEIATVLGNMPQESLPSNPEKESEEQGEKIVLK